jgi:hypothetical protein
MKSPSSFCTVSTKQCKHELILLLSSILYHHSKTPICIVCDTDTFDTVEPLFHNNTEIYWFKDLNEYSNLTRQEMTEKGIWSTFQMSKATAIEYALIKNQDTLFLDSDIVLLEPVKDIPPNKQLGVSRGYINKETSDKVGIYNGGFLWTNQKCLPEKWRQYTKTSRYFDQASIEELVKEYDYFEFSEQHNFQSWRFIVGDQPNPKMYFTPMNKHILYKEKRLQSIHTHFNDPKFKQINDFFIQQLTKSKMYHILQIITLGSNILQTIPHSLPQSLTKAFPEFWVVIDRWASALISFSHVRISWFIEGPCKILVNLFSHYDNGGFLYSKSNPCMKR